MGLSHLELENRQIWLRAFYGFDPEGAGYIGFTNEGDRRTMLEQMRVGDLVLIYGAVEDLTQKDLRAQALGFLEVTLEPCLDQDRMSKDSIAWKVDHGFEDRWTHGIKVSRAWRVNNRVGIKTIAPEAYQGKHRFERTTRAILLAAEERQRALSHPVRQVNVFGEPKVAEAELAAGPMDQVLRPSRGIPPSFGDRTSNYEDGGNQLYLMICSANTEVLFGESEVGNSLAIVKVGRSNDPVRRLKEINSGFPERSIVRWQLIQKQHFGSGERTHEMEDRLKAHFDALFNSEGGEFYSGNAQAIQNAFRDFCIQNMPKILGAPAKAKGI